MASERVQRQIDRLLDEAEAAIARFDWELVRQSAEAVLALSPDNIDAVTFLAAADRSLDNTAPQTTNDSITSTPRAAAGSLTDQPTSFANGR